MKKIISDIHNGIQNSRKTIEFLTQNSKWTWVGDYPIAVVNEINRIEDEKSLKKLQEINFFDEEGFSKHSYTTDEIKYLKKNVPSAIKTAYCLCLKKQRSEDYNFKEKFTHDRWKKVTDEDNFDALVEFSKFTTDDDSKTIETALRDIMRSSKEIPSLKCIGFVWIVTLPKTTNIVDILEHYFGDDHIFVEAGRKITYIAWGDTLANINMRYFVNTPS
ncbi:hypothetical protein MNB_SM-4-1078 [hydrothermal vent metagenome]|uniref:Uncharacterized protein n=1 Tax=hydrothermal vent metagenome TaxID=652676 RepID=A0A1W1CKI5_9ZZZZ